MLRETPLTRTDPAHVVSWVNRLNGSRLKPCPSIHKANLQKRNLCQRKVDVLNEFQAIETLLFTLVDCELLTMDNLNEKLCHCTTRQAISDGLDSLYQLAGENLDKILNDHQKEIREQFQVAQYEQLDYTNYIDTGDFSFIPEISVTQNHIALMVTRDETLSVLGCTTEGLDKQSVNHVETIIEYLCYQGCYRTIDPSLADYDWHHTLIIGDMCDRHVDHKRAKKWVKDWQKLGELPPDALPTMNELCIDDEECFIEEVIDALKLSHAVNKRWHQIDHNMKKSHITVAMEHFKEQYLTTQNEEYQRLITVCEMCLAGIEPEHLDLNEVGDIAFGAGRMVLTEITPEIDSLLQNYYEGCGGEQSHLTITSKKDIEQVKRLITVDVALSVLIA